ncbi:Uncharacterised protein [Mycobacterium tuberculosis]|nr:Uncharacterised protein [Mycobacterium tuberculosis]
MTRKAISSRLRPSKPGICSVSSAGTWLMQNTHTIRPHWIFEVRSRKRCVSPPTAARMGSSRKA